MLKCDFNKVEIALWHAGSPVNLLHILTTLLKTHLGISFPL